jgi:hypothetical protein
MKWNKGFFALIVLCGTLKAQYHETIRTGRPGQAFEPFSVGKNIFQTQTGFDFDGVLIKLADFSRNSISPNTLLRFGISNRVDINAAIDYREDFIVKSDSAYKKMGLSKLTLGTRINLIEGKNKIPAVGLQLGIRLPFLSEQYNHINPAPRIMISAFEQLGERFTLLINAGIEYRGNNTSPIALYVTNIGYTINSRWSCFIENYGNFSLDNFENRWDTGIAYLLHNDLQLDIYAGAGYNYGAFDYFTSLGFSWRINCRNNQNEK